MIRFGKGQMKKKLEETMEFLQSVETQETRTTEEERSKEHAKNS